MQLKISLRSSTLALQGYLPSVSIVLDSQTGGADTVVLLIVRLDICKSIVKVNEDVDEEEADTSEGEEDEDIRDVVHRRCVSQPHLFFGRAYEQESSRVETL
jgi:hypothetical protein